jgi:hypothetical protein
MAAAVVAVTAAASVEAVAFAVAGFVVALVAVAFVMVTFAAVGDPYNQPVYQGSAGYRRGESRSSSSFFKNWGIKMGLRRLY